MRRIKLIALAFGLVLVFGACAEDEPTVAEPDATTETTDEATDEATVSLADSEHGEILVMSDGMTLYAFLNDTDGSSTCVDACATTWPPLEADGDPTAGDGVDESLLGTTDRDEGGTQVTYNDHPLYMFSGDMGEGDTNGQGVGDKWYVVGADGEPVDDE